MSEPLVKIVPEEVLTFNLQKDASPKAILKVTNNSPGRVVFKVKTTQPTWYYVRPNQHMLDVGATEEVSIVLVDTECSRVISKFNTTGQTEKLDKHRFLVLTKEMEDDDFERISACTPAQRQDEFTKLWAAGAAPTKDDKRSMKMHVSYTYPRPEEESEEGKGRKIKESPKKESKSSGSNNSHSSPEPYKDSAGTGSSDLEALKSKYDAIVEYTVHLTAERDMIVTQLEVMKKEYNNELKQGKNKDKKNMESGAGSGGEKATGKDAEMKVVQGYSWMVILIVAVVSFLLDMSGTEFNAFELLAKLRGGQPLPESSVGGAVVTNPHAKHAQQTTVQKRERIEVRVELEKDIAKLNEEIVKLKYENKQLQAGKAELQQQLRDQKENSDDTIRQLRNTIIHLRKRVNTGGAMGAATTANNFDGTGASNRLAIPGRQSSQPLTNPAINRQLQYLPPPPPGMNQFGQSPGQNQENFFRNGSPDPRMGASNSSPSKNRDHHDPNNPYPGTTTSTLRRNSNFAGPTFSELMRRSAPVYKDFSSSLRDTKAFFVATPTVITNANQDPQFVVARRQSMAMHQAKLAMQQMAESGGYNSSGEGQFGNSSGYGSSDDHGAYQQQPSNSGGGSSSSYKALLTQSNSGASPGGANESTPGPSNPTTNGSPAAQKQDVRASIEQHPQPFNW